MDEVISLALNPDCQLGFVAGLAVASTAFVTFMALAGLLGRRADRRTGRVIASALNTAEHLQRTGDAIYYGDRPVPRRVPDAANDATLDLRDAHRVPRTARSELRRSPR